MHRLLIDAPKYGNNQESADRYAKWYVDTHYELFSRYHTHDGGGIYIGIASNVQNISAGCEVAATADGRKNGKPLSDAASPMRGMDKNGLTSVIHSVSKPDYTKAALGTVLNIKLSGGMFATEEKRNKLKVLLKTYFAKGGQEAQINAVSRSTLEKAVEHPEEYQDLIVRVSGFSAHYTRLAPEVQQDILARTEHE